MGRLSDILASLDDVEVEIEAPVDDGVVESIAALCSRLEAAIRQIPQSDMAGIEAQIKSLAGAIQAMKAPVVKVAAPNVSAPSVTVAAPQIDIPAPVVHIKGENPPMQFDIVRNDDGMIRQVIASPYVPEEVQPTEMDIE